MEIEVYEVDILESKLKMYNNNYLLTKIMLLIRFGSIYNGSLNKLKSAIDTNAFWASRTWVESMKTYVPNVQTETISGVADPNTTSIQLI